MREFAVRYVNGPLQGVGSISVPDQAGDEPPLIQRIPLPSSEYGLRETISNTFGSTRHAIYERSSFNETSQEWEFQLVRVE